MNSQDKSDGAVKLKLKLAQKQIRSARKLLDRAMDVIPDVSDGRNDKLTDAIEKWFEETE